MTLYNYSQTILATVLANKVVVLACGLLGEDLPHGQLFDGDRSKALTDAQAKTAKRLAPRRSARQMRHQTRRQI
jgi:hypothetical protein